MEAYEIVAARLYAIATDDDMQIESIRNTEFMDSDLDKQTNDAVIETLAARAEGIRKIAAVVENRGLTSVNDFRHLIVKKFFVRGYTAMSGTFYNKVDRLVTTLETLDQLGITSFEGKNRGS